MKTCCNKFNCVVAIFGASGSKVTNSGLLRFLLVDSWCTVMSPPGYVNLSVLGL